MKKVFISHGYHDREISDVLLKHLQIWGLSKDSVFRSSDRGGVTRWSLTEDLKMALKDCQVIFLIYTFPDSDWSYCMWEVGAAYNSDTKSKRLTESKRLIVIECTKDSPTIFPEMQRLTITKEAITTLTTQFHKEDGFFPKQPAFKPNVSKEIINESAKLLYEDLKEAIPSEDLKKWSYYKDMIQSHSIFGAPDKLLPTYDIFVLMPFREDLAPVYEKHIKSCAKRLGKSCGRADNLFSNRSIVEEIWSSICNASLVIADCTTLNANVFYEIGIAHTLDRKTFLIAQSIDDVPFDLRHRRVLVYDYTPQGMSEFEKSLEKAISDILGES